MSAKNFTTDQWLDIIRIVTDRTPYPIAVHGIAAESLDLPANSRFIFPSNPIEQIACFNRSVCFLSPDSGMVQFALNCRCDTLVLGGSQWFGPYLDYNPFGCRLELSPRESENMRPQIERFLKQPVPASRLE